VRDQIVAAATDHFRLYGYEKTTVSDLAKAIGFSKAYIYKFFESKQAIGELICANCLGEIEAAVRTAVAWRRPAAEKLRQMFKVAVESSLRLFFENRKLYDIAASAATGHWEAVRIFEGRIQAMLQDVLRQGREAETSSARRRWTNDRRDLPGHAPLPQSAAVANSFDYAAKSPAQLSSLVLRSLSPMIFSGKVTIDKLVTSPKMKSYQFFGISMDRRRLATFRAHFRTAAGAGRLR
jgi:AcrR family transcriptional regulator